MTIHLHLTAVSTVLGKDLDMSRVRLKIVNMLQTSGWNSAKLLMGRSSILMIFRLLSNGFLNTVTVSMDKFQYFLRSISSVGAEDKCKLYCRVDYSSAYYLLASAVADGTSCGIDTFDKCVEGQCVPAGCDHVLGSSAELGQ